MKIPVTPCVRCKHPTVAGNHHKRYPLVRSHARRMVARGLCDRCARRIKGTDEIFDYPRLSMPRDDVLDDWVTLRGEGYTIVHAAARLGITLDALSQALTRAKRAGDPRVGHLDWHGVHAANRERRAAQ